MAFVADAAAITCMEEGARTDTAEHFDSWVACAEYVSALPG